MGQVTTRAQLSRILGRLRQRHKRIVFTNGCFDLMHVGHVEYLARAKDRGDVLVVGLNSDSSVRRLKGKGRPILPQEDRAKLLAALEAVDYVTVFTEVTPHKLIRLVKPDILVKGADYKADNIAGADFVRSYGGKIKTIPLVKNKSTKLIIASILRRYAK